MKNNLKIIIILSVFFGGIVTRISSTVLIHFMFFSSSVISQRKVKVLARSPCDISVFLATALVKLQK